jgi:enoyl-CoA hydratase/carnithine racemase
VAAFEHIRVVTDGAVGRLTLSRPHKLNALAPETLGELAGAAAWFDARSDVRAVVVAGEGRAFCSGFDLGGIAEQPAGEGDAAARQGVELGRSMADAIAGMRALTVAAIHGHCVGGGLVLAAACDLRIATAGARFSIPEVDLGIPLAWGGIPRLVRELGPAITKELVLTCRPFDANEARELRFLNAIVSDDGLSAAAAALASRVASQPSSILQTTKRHVNAVAEEAGSTAQSFRDADALLAAPHDPEARGQMLRYLADRAGEVSVDD